MKLIIVWGIFFVSCFTFAQSVNGANKTADDSNEVLLNQFIQSKGTALIVFDSSNIKQFWIEKTVLSKKDAFEILLAGKNTQQYESDLLRIQLANVSEMEDCRIEIISNTKDFDFSVIDSNSNTVSSSQANDSFLGYSIVSAVFHLEDVQNLSFALKFESSTHNVLSIKNIVLSFSKNKNTSFVASPGTISIEKNSSELKSCKYASDNSDSFSVTGKYSAILSSKKILLSNNPVSSSVTIENTGEEPVTVYVGYIPFSKDGKIIHRENTPYKAINKVLKVLSSENNSNIVTVDSYPEWAKGCFLASNAKEDLSDFPNYSIEGTIDKINTIDDNKAEIVLTKPIGKAIPKDSFVRIQTPTGATYIYTNTKKINPGEQASFKSSIKKEDNFYQHSNTAFCHNTHFIIPIILSYSVDSNKTNTILIRDYIVSY